MLNTHKFLPVERFEHFESGTQKLPQVSAFFVMLLDFIEYAAETLLDLVDQDGQKHQSIELAGEALFAIPVQVHSTLVLVLSSVEDYILDFTQCAPGQLAGS